MKDEQVNQVNADSRPAYESPRALRLGDMHSGSGGIAACTLPGSGVIGYCSTGNSADYNCDADGNSPGAGCNATGSGVG